MVIKGVIDADRPRNGIVTDTMGRVDLLRKKWQCTFSDKPIVEADADRLLSSVPHMHRWDWNSCSPPSRQVYKGIIKRLNNSRPSTDGIPNVAYQAIPLFAADVAENQIEQICNTGVGYWGSNDVCNAFLPKKDVVPFEGGVAVTNEDVRPVGLKFCFIKLVTIGVVYCVA
eukprot:11124874-Karenia_brevis.AAC.1